MASEQSRGGARRAAPGPVQVIAPLRDFLASQAASGALLLMAAVVALVWANSPWRHAYTALWDTRASVGIGRHVLMLDLRHWVNDGLMTLFFLVVGLEIKRELSEGELRDPRHAALPLVAALGGMLVPALLYTVITAGTPTARGWGIPMATDIAVALGVLALAGVSADSPLKLFLLALAIVDDIGAIVVIALFYSHGLDTRMLLVAAALLVCVLLMRRAGVQHVGPYLVIGVALWLATHAAGVHATIAGVALGLLTPTRPVATRDMIDEAALVDLSTIAAAQETIRLARSSVSTVEWLEHHLQPWAAYGIVPLFAFANAGVGMSAASLRGAFSSRTTYGVLLGLVAGKFVGISGAAWLAVRSGLASLPSGLGWRGLCGAAVLGGVGFTVSLFVTDLAFADGSAALDAKVAILVATLLAALIGGALVRGSLRADGARPRQRRPAV